MWRVEKLWNKQVGQVVRRKQEGEKRVERWKRKEPIWCERPAVAV